jgi:hypothetical protein
MKRKSGKTIDAKLQKDKARNADCMQQFYAWLIAKWEGAKP